MFSHSSSGEYMANGNADYKYEDTQRPHARLFLSLQLIDLDM